MHEDFILSIYLSCHFQGFIFLIFIRLNAGKSGGQSEGVQTYQISRYRQKKLTLFENKMAHHLFNSIVLFKEDLFGSLCFSVIRNLRDLPAGSVRKVG
jgi:hypothetical protein